MSTKSVTTCDIKKCGKSASNSATTSVVFTTEQNEGRNTTPYFDTVKLDLCKEHFQTFIRHYPIRATGAMGHNEYTMEEG